MMTGKDASKAGATARAMILPLALAQFIASYAATNMNVAISAIAKDVGTTVGGVQTSITLFTLTMAALMIPGSKLTDIWGRKRCFLLGLGTQTIQWLILQGTFFTASVYLQEVNHNNAIQTGLILTPATIGILAASAAADRFARRHPQRWLIIAGFLITAVGMILLLVLVRAHAGIWRWIPGLLLFGAGVGDMLTASVNVVQSSFSDADQGEISGLSRSASNLGSSLGTALVGSVLVAVTLPEGRPFGVAVAILLVIALIGLVLAVLIPRQAVDAAATATSGTAPVTPKPVP
jgi:MFS family permease